LSAPRLKTKSLGTRKKAKAKIELGKFAQKLALIQAQPVQEKSERTMQELVADFAHFIKDNRSEGWAGIQRLYLKKMLEFFVPGTPVTDIIAKRIEEYASWRRSDVRGTTVNKELSTIRTMFDKAVDWKFIELSPAKNVKELPDDSAIHDRYLKPNEFETLLGRALAQRQVGLPVIGLQFQDFPEFVSLGVHTGLRLTEMLMLEFRDIDFENDILSVKKKPQLKFFVKNYQEQHIRLNSEALVALLSLKQRKAASSDFVFHPPGGDHWKAHVTTLQRQFSGLVRAAGLHHEEPSRNVTIHTLRHTFGVGWP
jgi:integrase